MSTKINKVALIENLQLQEIFANATKKQISEFIEDFFQIIIDNVKQGNEVTIPGFGKFTKFQKQDGSFKPKFTPFSQFRQEVKIS